MEVPLKPDKHMFHKPTWVKETQSESAMMTRSNGICKDGRYCVRLRVPIALRVMSTAVSTFKWKDHIQARHRKHTMWLPRKEGICHRCRRENTVNDHRRDIHLHVECHSFKAHASAQHVGGPSSEPHNWASAQTHKPLLSVNFPGTTQRSVQHQQDMHSAHTTVHVVTRRVHVVSFHAFLFLLLPVSSSCFCFPNPLGGSRTRFLQSLLIFNSQRFAEIFIFFRLRTCFSKKTGHKPWNIEQPNIEGGKVNTSR